jgi:Mn-dependent DtxR family transcriptional regulator
LNIRRAVLVYLSTDRRWPTSSADLAAELKCSWKAMRFALRKLQEEALVTCRVTDGNDAWALTPKGRSEAVRGWAAPRSDNEA